MATISRLKPDQIVYSLIRRYVGNTMLRETYLFEVRIISIDPNGKWVEASWNGNRPTRCYASEAKAWKVKKPQPKRTDAFGKRTTDGP
jgi:hypothetical protein